jgi:hypothetical protein
MYVDIDTIWIYIRIIGILDEAAIAGVTNDARYTTIPKDAITSYNFEMDKVQMDGVGANAQVPNVPIFGGAKNGELRRGLMPIHGSLH